MSSEDPDFEPIDSDDANACVHPAPSENAQQSTNTDDLAAIYTPELLPILLEEDDNLVNQGEQQKSERTNIFC